MRTLEFAWLAAGAAMLAAPSHAAIVQQHSPFGGYTVSYDPALQSPAITQLLPSFQGMNADLPASFQGEHDPNGPYDGMITSTDVYVTLDLTFTPDPGTAFTSLAIFDDVVSYHHGFYGGETFDETTVITPLHGGAAQTLHGPALSNIPPWGQGGGGAINAGIAFGSLAPPPGGFTVAMTQHIGLFDDSSFGFGRVIFEVGTAAAPAGGVPEPAAWVLMILGLGAAGDLVRRRRVAAA